MSYSNGQIRMLHLLKAEGPLTASQIASKLNCGTTSPLGWYVKLKKDGFLIINRSKLPSSGGKMVSQIVFALKDKDAELPPLRNAAVNVSSPGSIPEIQKLKQHIAHLIDEVQALEPLVVTKKERQLLDYLSKNGIKFKI